jgi:hypothetical protein
MTFLKFRESWQVVRYCIWSSNINQLILIDNKLNYLILFYLGLRFIFGSTY